MLDKKIQKKVGKIIKEFFDKTSFEVDFDLKEETDNCFTITAKTDEPQILIGQQGKTLFEIQLILAKILRKQLAQPLRLDLDINQYKQNKAQHLLELARETADHAALTKSAKALFPMTSYERRLVHLALADRTDVKTESSGQEPDRRVVISPA